MFYRKPCCVHVGITSLPYNTGSKREQPKFQIPVFHKEFSVPVSFHLAPESVKLKTLCQIHRLLKN